MVRRMSRIYIHELVDVVGTHRARYQHHMTANWSPEAGPLRHQQCFGVFSVVGSTGRWPQVLNLWEYETWADLAHNFSVELVGTEHRDEMLTQWWAEAAEFRAGGLDRILVADESSPSVADWQARGGTGAVAYLHETIGTRIGKARDAIEAVVGPGAEDHQRFGIELVGAYRTAMRVDDEVIAIWAVPDWDTWARYEHAADGGDTEFFHLWQRLSGLVESRERILLVDAELSPLRIGRQPSESDRRPLEEI